MAEIVAQGELDVAGTILCTGTDQRILVKLNNLRFNNPAAYVLTLERYDAATATSQVIYELTLDAGDTVTDNFIYALKNGDKLVAYSDVPGTSYYIYGSSYAIS